ncbi:MAG: tetratricopeptide repeat protein [Pseudomonadota bacterium]|nr:tetratricopeptide repeat protein [Pseudomonadota bacterium]
MSVVRIALGLCLCAVLACQSNKSRHVLTGNEYARDGLLKEAVSAYRLALQKDPNNHAASRNLGLLYVRMGKYSLAIKHLRRSLDFFRNDFDIHFYLGEAYRSKERYAEAIYRYRSAINIKPDAPEALKSLGWTYYKINLLQDAEATIKKFLTLDRNDYDGVIILARVYFRQNRYKSAMKLIEAYRAKVDARSLSYLQSIEGDINMKAGRIKVAMQLYRDALRKSPMLVGALLGLGRVAIKQKHPQHAIRYLKRAVRLNPKSSQAHMLLGQAYEGINVRKSLDYYRRYKQLARQQREPANQVAIVNSRIERLQKATN